MNEYQLTSIRNCVESGAFTELFKTLDLQCFESFKLNVDKPEKISDTISMIRGLRTLEAAIQSVVNELQEDDLNPEGQE